MQKGDNNMKILFLNADIGFGGAEKSMVFVANAMAARKHEVIFLTYRNDVVCQKLNSQVTHLHLPLENASGNGRHLLSTVRALRRYIQAEHFDLAVAFLSPSQLRLILACKGTKTKVVLSQRGDPYHVKKSLFSLFFERIFQRADGFVFQMEKSMDYYGEKVKERGTVIPNPCQPLTRTKPIDGDRHVIVTASRLDIKQKRQDLLIEAFRLFSPNHPDYQLHIFGDGEDREVLEKLIRSDCRIILKGKTDDIAAAIQQATFFVLTSDYEGIPNALIEAMSLGLPCISTKCSPGGAEYLIQDGVSGLLVDCGDAAGLAEAMDRLANDDALRRRLSENALYVNEKFRPDGIAQQWEDFLIGIEGTK